MLAIFGLHDPHGFEYAMCVPLAGVASSDLFWNLNCPRNKVEYSKGIVDGGIEMAQPRKGNILDSLAAQIRICTKCPLHQSRILAVPGDGKYSAKVMIIGEAPGREEDESGHPFVGAAGRFLDRMLEGTGHKRADFFITNIVKCRPPKNRVPKKLEVDTCTSNYLFEQIALINPKLIVLLGGVAAKKILGIKSINEARGKVIEHDNRKYLVGYHPAAQFYREDLAIKVKEDFLLLKNVLKAI
jgi:DNA polymerase